MYESQMTTKIVLIKDERDRYRAQLIQYDMRIMTTLCGTPRGCSTPEEALRSLLDITARGVYAKGGF